MGGGDDKGEVPDPPHGAREDDNLPFDDAGFVNDSPDDTIPDYHRRRPAQPSSRSSHRLEGARVWTSSNRRVIVQPQVIKRVFRSTFSCTTLNVTASLRFKCLHNVLDVFAKPMPRWPSPADKDYRILR